VRVGVFHPGSQNAWQRATAFQESGTLAWFASSSYFHPDSLAVRLAGRLPGGAGLRHQLLRRHFPLLDPARVRRRGQIELAEIALRRLPGVPARRLAEGVNRWGNRRFAGAVIDLIRREPVDVVWGYNSAALEVFRWARDRGLTCVLDQSIGHPAAENAVLAGERARHPDYIATAYRPHDPAWIARNDAEIALADKIVVGSAAAARTLTARGCDPAKIHVVPYGWDETLFPARAPARPPPHGRPLHALFVGAVGPRKGAAYLLQALDRLPPNAVEATLVGRCDLPPRTFARHAGRIRHIPQVPRGAVAAHFAAADVFVFPSLFEGGGVVLAEALGAGLPIVQGPDSGVGAEDGVSGRVLTRLSVESLASALAELAADPDRLATWQAAAWRQGRNRRWADYRRHLRAVLTP